MSQFSPTIDDDLLTLLVCPRDRLPLSEEGRLLVCKAGHRYPVVDGVPVFLCAERGRPLKVTRESILAAETGAGAPYYLDTVGSLCRETKSMIEEDLRRGKLPQIDPVISWRLLATSGYGYGSLQGRLKSYPIPDIPFPIARVGERLLDVGCNWGRWSLSAARKGWRVVGIDPSLGAIL